VAAACALGFVVAGAAGLDLGQEEARLGLAASEAPGPFGQVFGHWSPELWPARVIPSWLCGWLAEKGWPSTGAVRWPAAIAAIAAGLILVRRAYLLLGGRAGALLALAWFGSFALIDRSSATGIDWIGGVCTLAALDCLLDRGAGWTAGLWLSLAFLAGGWPPLVVVLISIVVLGRSGARFSFRLLAPPVVAFAAWSVWALSQAPAAAWAAALTLPLTQKSAWWTVPTLLSLALPWTPFAAIGLSRKARESLPDSARSWLVGWLQIAAASTVVGTLVPGLSEAARLPALAGILIAASLVLELAWAGLLSKRQQFAFFGLSMAPILAWLGLSLAGGLYLAVAAPYYRGLGFILLAILPPLLTFAYLGYRRLDASRVIVAMALVAIALKLSHSCYYAPEWNYRLSQGPWGRAIGQWVLPRWPVYTIHGWDPALAFAIERPVYQIPSPKHLAYQPGPDVKYVLLIQSEFENWPEDAPRLVEVARFRDRGDQVRVLARTEGELPAPALVQKLSEDRIH
jgi:hypothetical protein